MLSMAKTMGQECSWCMMDGHNYAFLLLMNACEAGDLAHDLTSE